MQLLDYGADPSRRDNNSCMPAQLARAPAMLRLLEEVGKARGRKNAI